MANCAYKTKAGLFLGPKTCSKKHVLFWQKDDADRSNSNCSIDL